MVNTLEEGAPTVPQLVCKAVRSEGVCIKRIGAGLAGEQLCVHQQEEVVTQRAPTLTNQLTRANRGAQIFYSPRVLWRRSDGLPI